MDQTVVDMLAEMRADQEPQGSNDTPQSEEEKPASFGRLVALSKPEAPVLIVAVVLSIVTIGLDILTPKFKAIMDNVILYPWIEQADIYGVVYFTISSDQTYEIRRFTLISLALRGASFILGLVKAVIFGLAAERVVARLRLQLFAAMLKQEMGFFDKRTSGELSSRLGADALLVQFVATMSVPDAVLSFIRIAGATVMMFLQSWQMSLMIIALIPLTFLYALPLTFIVQRLNKNYQDAIAVSSNIATQSIQNIKVVRSCGAEAFASMLYGHAVGDPALPGVCCWWPKPVKSVYRIGVLKAIVQQFMIQGAIAIASTGLSGVLWYGYDMVIDDRITYGTFGAFITYAMITGFNAGILMKTFVGVQNAKGASQRVFEIIDRRPSIVSRGGKTPQTLKGEVVFEDVTFSYPSRPDVTVLAGITFRISPQTKAAFVGSSGGGKSTLLALVQRLYDVSGGRVLIDGCNVQDLDAGWLRRKIVIVQQEPVLFGFSIAENIRFGCTARSIAEGTEDVSEEDIIHAAKQANAHSFISKFPEGYDTLVGERGLRLSGGQKQRIAIARALLCDPRLLLLDEATSALDTASERQVQQALDRAMANRTVMVVAHRLSTIIGADQIFVMTSSGIADSGKHDELLERSSVYKELVQRQSFESVAGEEEQKEEEEDEEEEELQAIPNEIHEQVTEQKQHQQQSKASERSFRRLDESALEKIVLSSKVVAKADAGKKRDDHPEERVNKGLFTFFLKLVRPELPVILTIVFLTLFVTAFEAYLPILQGDLVNWVVGDSTVDRKKQETANIMLFVISTSIGVQIWHFMRAIVCGIAGERVVGRVRLHIFQAIFRQDMSFFDTMTSGVLTSRLTSDTQIIQIAAASGIAESFIGLAKAGAALAMSFAACWQLASMALAVGPAMVCVLCLPAAWLVRVSVRYNDALARSVHVSTEATSSAKTVIAFGSEEFVELLYSSAVGRISGHGTLCWWPMKSQSTYRYGTQRSVGMRALMQVATWLSMSIMSLIMWYGYHLILTDQLTFGEIMAFAMQAMNIAQGSASFFGGVGSVIAARAALQRVFEIESREPSIHNESGDRPELTSMHVCFKDVHFSYPSRADVQVLEGISFSVPAYTTAAFVGPSGSGKSTVLALLARFYEVSGGSVLVGGHQISSLDASWFRRRIGIVQQEPVLFGVSIRENIAYARNAMRLTEGGSLVTDEDVEKAAQLANAHSFISKFPNGYRTRVGERGILLSGGQKQRLAVARALLGEPQMLLLDEATSALDAESEHLVQQAIIQAMKDRTVLIVAHRLSTVRHAHQIFVMADRCLVDSGTHEELIERCETYKELVKHQMRVTVGPNPVLP